MKLWGSDMRDRKTPEDAALLGVPYGRESQNRCDAKARYDRYRL
jgi:hypothetical protein